MMISEPLSQLLTVYSKTYLDELQVTTAFLNFVVSDETCFDRSNKHGHITGSAWVVSPDYNHILLMHHTKLDKWIQLGGHADGNHNVLEVAVREAMEESGITSFTLIVPEIFDIDIHEIPENSMEMAHLHYDVRFVMRADSTRLVQNHESKDLLWVPMEDISKYTKEPSIQRMTKKWSALRQCLR